MSTTKLNDLEELVLAVREPESRRLLEEAVNAYRGGAFRSALISTWIAVAYDIISKIRELAARGEANAKLFVTDLTTAIDTKNVRRLQEIENGHLTNAQTDFAFLLPHEATDLQRLFDDRDLCAHPAFVGDDTLFTPSPELLRAHIAHAVHHLLAHPPVQGKSALSRLHRDLLGSGFPVDEASVEVVMRENYLHQTKDSVVVAIAKGLLLTPLRAERAKFKGKERPLALAFAAVGKIRPDLFEREMPAFFRKTADETVEPEFLDLLRFLAAEPRCWQWMDQPSRIRMTEILRRESLTRLIPVGCFDTLHIPDLAQVLLPRVSSADDEQKFNIISENPKPQFVDEAIELYSKSGSFRTAELRGEKLILAHANFFKAEDVAKTLSVAAEDRNNQILDAVGTSDILIKLFDTRLDLLPYTKAAWKGLHDALTARHFLNDCTYPTLVGKLQAQGVI
jgi:hypothetical protein